MQITTAPALFFGLGVKIFLNKFIYHYENSSIADFVFLGLWQGTAVYYLLMRQVEFAWAAAVGILGRLLFDFVKDFDTSKCACTLLGVALGVLVTDILSQFIEDDYRESYRSGDHHGRTPTKSRSRLVQFSKSEHKEVHRENGVREKGKEKEKDKEKDKGKDKGKGRKTVEPNWEARSIITANSISSSSDLVDPNRNLTPLQREVANLRAKASLADTERRRFKEEKKWALSQGNHARASQMSWQVRRYAALVESFHREADARLLEASRSRPHQPTGPAAPQNPPPGHTDRHGDHPTVVNIEFAHHHRKRSSGTLKPTIRVQGREVRDPGPSNIYIR